MTSNNRTNSWQIRAISLLLAIELSGFSAIAGSYSVTIQDGEEAPLAWSFQNTTVASAFPSPSGEITIYVYNPIRQSYSVADYSFGSWSNGGLVLTNGIGFYLANHTGSTLNLTVSGTDVVASTTTFSYSANTWYFLGYAYPQSTSKVNAIECVEDTYLSDWHRYTFDNLGYTSTAGDEIQNIYDPSTSSWNINYRSSCNTDRWFPYWSSTSSTLCTNLIATGMSPQIQLGQGFWFKPAANTSWTHYKTTPSCP